MRLRPQPWLLLLLAACSPLEEVAQNPDPAEAGDLADMPAEACDRIAAGDETWSTCLYAGTSHLAPFVGTEEWPDVEWAPLAARESFRSGVFFEARRRLSVEPGRYELIVSRAGAVRVDVGDDGLLELDTWEEVEERVDVVKLTIVEPTLVSLTFRHPRGLGTLSVQLVVADTQVPDETTDVIDDSPVDAGQYPSVPDAGVSIDEPVDEPIDETVDEPIDETVDEPIDETVDEPIDEPVDEPVDEPIDEPVDEPIDEPVDEPVDEPIDTRTDEPTEAPAGSTPGCNEASFPTGTWNVCLYAGENAEDGFVGAKSWGALDRDWGTGRTAPAPADRFSLTARTRPSFAAGQWVFHAISDDGVQIDVGANGSLELDDWANHSTRERKSKPVSLNGRAKILVRYHEHTGPARLKVWWTKYTPPPPPASTALPACAHRALLTWGLHPDASDRLRCAGITSADRISQTIGDAAASAGTHAQDGRAQGHPYSAATDIRIRGLSRAEFKALASRLADQGFAAFVRIPGEDGWPSNEALHLHAIYVGCHMKAALQAQVRDWLAKKNGLRNHATYRFWQSSDAQKARVKALFAAHN